mgnify:CR=1 FL=1
MEKITNKIVLKVELLKNNNLKLTLLYLDKIFLTVDRNFKFFNESTLTSSFYIYSRDIFSIQPNSLRFPDAKNYKNGIYAEKKFDSDEQRYIFLKRLHNTLTKWNNKYPEFKKYPQFKNKRCKIKFNNSFWIL